ncbi:uncharacterized protein LOC126195645 [Schistocerca nitens]|uniref:uncharacterized protein LOC126195645 n=1 Tax=Schistocerca nitens TaxID=7011 RepID=UPI002118053A|nr:uncharacterized protein LOC126195645 [Schistocerca nitens]
MSCENDTDMLIAEVEGRPHIWDPSHGDYKNREMRLKAWLDVCANIILGFEGLNEADQKKCFDKVQTRWKTARDAYFKSLTRINQTRSGSAATKRPKYIYHEQKRPIKNTTFEDNLLTLLKDGKEKEEDDDRAFFISLLPSVKTLNVDQKLLFRTQVLQLLMSIKQTNQPSYSGYETAQHADSRCGGGQQLPALLTLYSALEVTASGHHDGAVAAGGAAHSYEKHRHYVEEEK